MGFRDFQPRIWVIKKSECLVSDWLCLLHPTLRTSFQDS